MGAGSERKGERVVKAGYRVAITADGAHSDGTSIYGDLGLSRLDAHDIEWRVLSAASDPVRVSDLVDFDAVWSMLGAHFSAELLADLPRLRHIARFGAGFDTIDVDACTRLGIAVTNAPDGVRRPLALAALTLVLACAHSLPQKQRVVRSGGWSGRGLHRGHGIDGKTMGIVGYGSVGRELAGLALGVGLHVVAANRHGFDPRPNGPDVAFAKLDDLLSQSDYVVVTASLNADNIHLIDRRRLRLLKPDAFLINVGRGRLLEQEALVTALTERWFAGAALDVFEEEPLATDHPLQSLDNVILTPHSLCWTEELGEVVATSAIADIIDVANGVPPTNLVNPEVLSTGQWKQRAIANN